MESDALKIVQSRENLVRLITMYITDKEDRRIALEWLDKLVGCALGA